MRKSKCMFWKTQTTITSNIFFVLVYFIHFIYVYITDILDFSRSQPSVGPFFAWAAANRRPTRMGVDGILCVLNVHTYMYSEHFNVLNDCNKHAVWDGWEWWEESCLVFNWKLLSKHSNQHRLLPTNKHLALPMYRYMIVVYIFGRWRWFYIYILYSILVLVYSDGSRWRFVVSYGSGCFVVCDD